MIKQKNIINRHAPLILGVGLILLWELAAYFGWLPRFIIPSPSLIFQSLIEDWKNLLFHSKITLIQAFVGLSIGIVLAFFLAIFMDLFEWLQRALYPLLIITQTIPTVAIAPILVLWLGYDMTPKIVLIVITTLFPIVISILNGFANSDQEAIQLLQLMGANKVQILSHVKLPASMPYFFSGLKVSVSYAFVGSVVAEWLGGFEGLGVYMIQMKNAFRYDRMFAVIVVISSISLLFMWVTQQIQRLCIPWLYHDKKITIWSRENVKKCIKIS